MKIYCLKCCKPIAFDSFECSNCECNNFSIFKAGTEELWNLFNKFYKNNDFYRAFTIIQFLNSRDEQLAIYYKGILYDEYKTKYSKEDAFKIARQFIKQVESLDLAKDWLKKNEDRTQALQTKEIKIIDQSSYYKKEVSTNTKKSEEEYEESIVTTFEDIGRNSSPRLSTIEGFERETLDADYGYLEDFSNLDTNDY